MLLIAILSAVALASEAVPICPGDLYSVRLDGDAEGKPTVDTGAYRVAKVLAVRPPLLFVRIYRNRWDVRPTTVDTKELVVGKVSDPKGYGTSCIGIAESLFLKEASPQALSKSAVNAEELERAEEQMRVNGMSDAADAGTRSRACGRQPTLGPQRKRGQR